MQKTKLIHTSSVFINLSPRMIRIAKSEISKAAANKLTHPQYRILSSVMRGIGNVGQMAADHGISQPAMSKMVDALVRKKLLQRSHSKLDRRQKKLKLTSKGLEHFEKIKRIASKNLSTRLESLNNKDQLALTKTLNNLDALLKKLEQAQEKEKK